jgi:hypothetical protein
MEVVVTKAEMAITVALRNSLFFTCCLLGKICLQSVGYCDDKTRPSQ